MVKIGDIVEEKHKDSVIRKMNSNIQYSWEWEYMHRVPALSKIRILPRRGVLFLLLLSCCMSQIFAALGPVRTHGSQCEVLLCVSLLF